MIRFSRTLSVAAVSLLLLGGCHSSPTNLRVVDGYLIGEKGGKTWVGLNTSAIMSSVLPLFPPPPNISTLTAIVNSSVLRYLQLEGTYVADVTLSLPSVTVLDMRQGGVIEAAAVSPGPALVEASGSYSAVLGGNYDCRTAKNITGKQLTGISAAGKGFVVRGASVNGCGYGNGYETGNIRVRGHGGEVSFCEITGGTRGIWTETITSFVVHDNHMRHTGVGIDVDGNSGPHLAVYNNAIEDSGGYGLWMEEGSEGVAVFNNTIRNSTVGIYLYNNGVKDRTLSQLMVVGNTVSESRMAPVGFGSHNGMAALTQQNMFASNVFKNNSGAVFDQGGGTDTWFVSNQFDQPAGAANSRLAGLSAEAVSVLDP